MASTATIFSVMLVLSLFMSSTVVSAARQLTENPKVTGDQSVNSEKSKVATETTKANPATSLGDKKFFIPIPIPIPIPFPRNIFGLPKTPSLPGPAGDLPSLAPPLGPGN